MAWLMSASRSSRRLATRRMQLVVVVGLQRAQGQVLQLGLDLGHAEPVGQRGVDVERLLGDLAGLARAAGTASVRMLCSRSASLIISTRRSRAMATSILRKFSAWRSSREEKASLPILVTPSTRSAISLAELALEVLLGGLGVLQDVVEQAGRHRGDVHLEVDQEAGDLQGVGQVRLAGGALLTLVGDAQRTGRRARGGRDRRPAGTWESPRSASAAGSPSAPSVDHPILRAIRLSPPLFSRAATRPLARSDLSSPRIDARRRRRGRVRAGDDARRTGRTRSPRASCPRRTGGWPSDRKMVQGGEDGPRQRLVDRIVHLLARTSCPCCETFAPVLPEPVVGHDRVVDRVADDRQQGGQHRQGISRSVSDSAPRQTMHVVDDGRDRGHPPRNS